ncbi:MAG: hypothetical protein ACUVWR_11965 [Anaerolineae bacterium]
MTLADVIRDIHILNRELEAYEEKYGLLSKDFYELYIQGKLPDEKIEEIDEYGQWAAAYRMKLHRESVYEKLARGSSSTLALPQTRSEVAQR